MRSDHNASAEPRPLIIGVGGTTRDDSSSERAVRAVLREAAAVGADTEMFGAARIEFPMYAPERPGRVPAAVTFVEAVRRADGLVIASPGYHGGLSGLVKNALDYIEDLRADERPYLDGRAVGCVACAYGWQATTTTLVSLRSVVHALRGWPTPLGIAMNSANRVFAEDGSIADEAVAAQTRLLATQVVRFARLHAAAGSES
ncbi:NADPH-dependent FMN reductase [Conexibacter sp. CPCC 206217]|uniref:NADPH-dependent FMN reductase n=1 Tax=Conexibacter sp. CPCC 206217 TaxID=3064574 RepID=UPI002721ED51|nr:NAD(P)H-dependent oxidoreductase [Conexibacter sp. CPCC 206217]MDO8212013.1 NAD(P)H-dependent oxidoreductase [Conexibacter sp. CPCC 206217]